MNTVYFRGTVAVRGTLAAMSVWASLGPAVVHAQPTDWPARPVVLINPFSAGSAVDVVGRGVAQKMAQNLGQAFNVDNRTGASGNIGTEFAARARPDGYTLLLGSPGTMAINPFLSPTPKKIAGLSVNPHALARLGNQLSFGLVSKLLPRHEYVFENAIRKQNIGEPDVGFTRVHLGHIFAIGRYGEEVVDRAGEVSKEGGLGRPAFMVISDKDPTADPQEGQRLADQIGARKIVLATDKHNPFLWRTSTEPAELKLRAEVHRTISRALKAGQAIECVKR